MITRPAGPDPAPPDPTWDARAVELWLLSSMRRLKQGVSILAAPGNALIAADPSLASAPFDILAFARTVLKKDSNELKAVIAWTRIRADGGDIEASIAEWCLAHGWNERSFHRRRKRACECIAQAKNRADHEKAIRDAAAA